MGIRDFTKTWWEKRLLNGLEAWLIRLRATEHDAANRFQLALDTWPVDDKESRDVFVEIMEDERRHSAMVERVLVEREIQFPAIPTTGRERYWEQVWPHVTGFKLACASLALGETLAIVRFRVIAAHPKTPEYVRSLVNEIIPDEERHINNLSRLAGVRSLNFMKKYHKLGMKAINIVS